jgi:hypothetical protein
MTILGFLAWLFGGCNKPTPNPSKPTTGVKAGHGLREMALTMAPSEVGIQPTEEFPKVYGVLMEWRVSEHTATVVSMCDGSASLYTTSSFGIAGGIGHETVRAAATSFVRTAQKSYDASKPTNEYPYPASGHVFFYLMCFDGVRLIDTEFGAPEYSGLWEMGRRVLTELELAADK